MKWKQFLLQVIKYYFENNEKKTQKDKIYIFIYLCLLLLFFLFHNKRTIKFRRMHSHN